MNGKKIKVAIYEDNDSLRESLSFLVKGADELEFCGAYSDGNSVVANCKMSLPDVVIMDIDMPGLSGIEATYLIKESYPSVNILIYTVFSDQVRLLDALCAGASGYLLKKSSAVHIIESIVELFNGGAPMTGEIARKVLEFFAKTKSKKGSYALSTRELEILSQLVKGDSYKMIAEHCFISVSTVRTHINAIYKKLHVNSKSEAVIKAMKERIV